MSSSIHLLFRTFVLFLLAGVVSLSTALPVQSAALDPDRLEELRSHFERSGTDIAPYLADERFELYEGITQRFTRSAERKSLNFDEYKKILGFEAKKQRIVTFIQEHQAVLEDAEEQYDIPKFVIAAILGVESDFGQNVGSYNPFNAYVSMYAENYRADFALAQLEELIEFTERHDIDPMELKSSYAGAMSYAQFIPYSLNQWFVGADIWDMHNNIYSIGNYLAHFKRITGSIDGAVLRYNPSRLYTDAVIALATEAEALYNEQVGTATK
ncbi:MAG: lytic murein transglycosylase [Bacteroidota bacterium]